MDATTELKRTTLDRHLRRHIQGEVRFDPTSRRLYSTDASIYQVEPLGVVLPRSVQDLAAVVQIAAEMRIPITARGGGTSLSGQSIGPGVVVDCSKYLNRVLDLDPTSRTVRVQPGLVLDELNRAAAAHGLQFGPEVATASRACLGGMIGNNSAGARSLVYGKTIDHVLRLQVLFADGRPADLGPLDRAGWEHAAARPGREGDLYRDVRQIVLENVPEIARRFPRIPRRVSGYNLDRLAVGLTGGGAVGLHELVLGSEGTLAVVMEAELALVPKPRARGLLVPHFSSLAAAMDALQTCLDAGPTAVELLDGLLIRLARANLGLRSTMSWVQGDPDTLFMVEFAAEDPAEVADRVDKLARRLRGTPGVTALVPALDPAVRDPLWALRASSLPLLYGLPGDAKPVTFVEDTAVSPAVLPEYAARFRELLHKHGTDGAFYGHASVGCLHIRPMLNLKDPADVVRMKRITEDVTDLVLEYGGSLSGEHGDGMVRSEWNRKMFGPVVYEAFRRVKHLFDPEGVLNPGKVVDAAPMTDSLRYGPDYQPHEPATVFTYARQQGMVRAVEACNGSGVCRKLAGGAMCPSFRATRDEKDSTRGRANALRLALAGERPVEDYRSRWVLDVLDLCLMCKACKSECPANVDMAKLKAEFLEAYYEHRLRPLGHYLVGRLPWLSRLAAPVAPVVNRVGRLRPFRWLLEKVAGVDRRRSLPVLHREHFRRWFASRKPALRRRGADPGPAGRVVLLDDCFTTWHEPQVGRAAVRVLEAAGYEVELAGVCCGRTLLSKGLVRAARDLVHAQAEGLAKRLADGTPLVGLEPSCLLTLADEWTELAPGEATAAIAAAAALADGWLAEQVAAGQAGLALRPGSGRVLLHGHCHQKVLVGSGGSAAALRLVPGLEVNVLDAGCCGMAGAFGFEKEHYDVSVRIAELALLPALRADEAAAVAAPGTSCRHQILDLAGGRTARHPLEILAEHLDGAD